MSRNEGTGGRSAHRSNDAIGAIAALGMLAAPTAVGVANASATPDDGAEVRCVKRGGAEVEKRFGGDSDVVADLAAGDEVTLLETREGQSRVRYRVERKRRIGWVESRALVKCKSASDAPPAATPPASPPEPVRRPAGPGLTTLGALDAQDMRAHYINVGQGAATLYEFSCGAVLVDTGGESNGGFDSDRALRAYLDDFFDARPDLNRTLSLLVISHPHIDHAHGAAFVTAEYQVSHVVTDGLVKDPESGNFYSGGRQQDKLEQWAKAQGKLETITTDGVPKGGKTSAGIDPLACSGQDPKIRALWGSSAARPEGWSLDAFKDANNHSVALRIDFGKASFLTTGDLEVDALPALVAHHRGSRVLDVDVWQVSHHGSANGTDDALLDALTPEIALMGTGDPNRTGSTFSAFAFGHPRRTVIDELVAHLSGKRARVKVPVADGVKEFEDMTLDKAIYATGWDGTVVVIAHADGTYEVATER